IEEDILRVKSLKPQLTFPCKIAVYLLPGERGSWRWTPQDKELMASWATALKKEGIASDVFMMSELFAPSSGLKELRVAAARHGADALFVIQGASQVDNYLNLASVLDLTVVGGFLVPGSHCDALFVMQGGLVDVGNGFIYASVESEGQGKIVRPTFI